MHLHEPIDLKFTDHEINIIDRIQINKTLQFLNYYDAEKFEDKMKIYIDDIGDNSEINNDLTHIIHRIVKKVLADTKQESAIIWIRTQVDSTKNFRWHRDGAYFTPLDNDPIVKFVVTLRGNSTPIVIDQQAVERFNHADKQFMEILNCIHTKMNLSMDLQIHLIKDYQYKYIDAIGNDYISTNVRDGIYFLNMINKSTDFGTIHSEPNIEKDRLFIAILPYTKEKCRQWIEKQIKY